MARITDEGMMQRCWDNGYRFYIAPFDNNRKLRIELQLQNEYKIGKEEYKQDRKGKEAISDKIRSLYLDLYFMYKHKFVKDKVWCFKKNEYIDIS